MPGVDLHLSNFVLVSPPSGMVSKLKTGKNDITLSITHTHTHTNVQYKLLKLSVVKIHLTTDMNVMVLRLDPVF